MSSLHFVSARYCVLSSTCQHVKSLVRLLRVVCFEGGKGNFLSETGEIRRGGVQYQWTDGVSCVAHLGRFDWDHDAVATAAFLESRSRGPNLRRVSASVADVLALDIGFGVNLEHPPANDFKFRPAGS